MLDDFGEDEWEDLVEDELIEDVVDPSVDWGQITEHLDEYLEQQRILDQIGEVGCDDTEHETRDSNGRGCVFYNDYPATCGDANTEFFVAEDVCCACGGGTTGGGMCENTDEDVTDPDGFGCEWYNQKPADCGKYDDSDFESDRMCCVCGGGQEIFDPVHTEVESLQEVMAQADGVTEIVAAVIHHPMTIV